MLLPGAVRTSLPSHTLVGLVRAFSKTKGRLHVGEGARMGCGFVAKEDKVEFEGEVIEALPNAMFRVKLDNEHVVLGHVAGKMRRFRIRILPGDRVRCELSPYDLDRARIVYRHR